MKVIPELIPLEAQAMFAPTPEWEAAARQTLAVERARPHAAAGGEEEE
jgi:hypothetical protein